MKGKIVCIFIAIAILIGMIVAIVLFNGNSDTSKSNIQSENYAAGSTSVDGSSTNYSADEYTEVIDTVSIPLDVEACCE